MRIFISLSFLLCSLTGFANTQTAEDLFKARGENTQNAFKSYEIYLQMAQTETNKDVKAEDYWHASQAVYYVGSKAIDNADKKKYHQLGYEAAAKGVALLEGQISSLNPSQKEALANSYYFYGAHLGKWGEANGIASSLGRWPELQETMKKIIAMKMAHVQDYGAYRILGRAFYKLPFPLGSNKKALKYLETAFEETKNGQDVSHHGLNIIYYANVLIAEDNKALAKSILSSFVTKDPMTLNIDRIPETKDEIFEAKEILKGL
jgi:hypothetical protein